MKVIASSFAQLTVIIMLMITLAVSTAALSQWANSADTTAPTSLASSPIK